MNRDSSSNQQAHASFQPRSPQSAIDPTQLNQPVHHSSSTSDLGAKWLNKASGWVANRFQTAQIFMGSGDTIAPDQILPALKGAASTNQPLVGVIDSGFGANEHGSKMVEAIQKENPQAKIWQGSGVGSGSGLKSLVEFVDVAKATGQRAVANLSFDLTEVHPDGSTSTRAQLTAEEQSALAYARDNGVLVVASSGNQGGAMSALGQASQPSDNLIVVGAANGSNRASYSSYGNGLDLVAEVGAAGTSLAAAKVTGAIANIWSANPDLSGQQVNQLLTATATDLKAPGWDAETGAGLLNTTGAIDLATHTTPEAIVFSGAQLVQQVPGSLAGATWESREGAIASEQTAGLGDWVHGALDVAGFIPGVGAVADIANAGLYAAEGDYTNAALSAAAAVPGIGDAAAAVKLANRGVQAARAANRATRAPVPIRPRPSSPPNRPPTRPALSGASGRPASNPRPPQRQTGGASNPRPPQRQTGGASNPRPPQRQTGGASNPRPPQRQTGGASNPRQNANPQPHARGDRQPDRLSTRSRQERNQQIRETISETSMEALASIAEQYAGEIPALQGVMDVVGLFGGRRSRAENPRGDRAPVAVGGGSGRTRPSSPSTTGTAPGSTTGDRNSRADSAPAPRSGGSSNSNQPPQDPLNGGVGSRPAGGYDDSNNNGLPAGGSRDSGNGGSSSPRPNRPGSSSASPDPYSPNEVGSASFQVRGKSVTHSPYITQDALENGRFFTYTLRNAKGEVRYVGRTSSDNKNGAQEVFLGRMAQGKHETLDDNFGEITEIRIEGHQSNAAANAGAEDVLYTRYQIPGEKVTWKKAPDGSTYKQTELEAPHTPPNGKPQKMSGGINEGGQQLLNRTNPLSNKPRRIWNPARYSTTLRPDGKLGGFGKIVAFAKDLW